MDTGLTGEMLTTLHSSEDDKPSNQYEDAENMANSTHHTKHQEQDTTDPELHSESHRLTAEESGYDNILTILVKETAFR